MSGLMICSLLTGSTMRQIESRPDGRLGGERGEREQVSAAPDHRCGPQGSPVKRRSSPLGR